LSPRIAPDNLDLALRLARGKKCDSSDHPGNENRGSTSL
jgi:hypothetical protein